MATRRGATGGHAALLRPQLLALLVLVAVSRACAYINDWVPSGAMCWLVSGSVRCPLLTHIQRTPAHLTPRL